MPLSDWHLLQVLPLITDSARSPEDWAEPPGEGQHCPDRVPPSAEHAGIRRLAGGGAVPGCLRGLHGVPGLSVLPFRQLHLPPRRGGGDTLQLPTHHLL